MHYTTGPSSGDQEIDANETNTNPNRLLCNLSANISDDKLGTFDFDAFFEQTQNDLPNFTDPTKVISTDLGLRNQLLIDEVNYYTLSDPIEQGNHLGAVESDPPVHLPPHSSNLYSLLPYEGCIPASPVSFGEYTSPQLALEMAGVFENFDTPGSEYFGNDKRQSHLSPERSISSHTPQNQHPSLIIQAGRMDEEAINPQEDQYSRTVNMNTFNPSKFYKPLNQTPESWAPPGLPANMFKYNSQGELDPLCRFSRDEINDYLTYHPLHMLHKSSPSTKSSGLILWVQSTPAHSSRRYPTKFSSKCRFANCPVKHGTIRNGQFRVAFDEQSIFDQPLDPYHNAGYVHLFCMEKNFDFPRLCKCFNVKGDDRHFPDERNKMSIIRDHPRMLQIVDDFTMSSMPWGNKRPTNWYDFSLSLALTKHHLQHQSNIRQLAREARNGNSIDRHLNNLDVMVDLGDSIRKRKACNVKRRDTKSLRK